MSSAKDATTKPAKPERRRGWRIFFTTFKWCRISALLFVLVVIILGLFLNHVGLPAWLEKRVQEQFRANGWQLEFSRLRLRWYHGIVAEHLQLQRTNAHAGPHLFVQTAEFRLNWKAFRHFDLEADSAMLRDGRLIWPLPGTNQPRRTLVLNKLGGELIFHPRDFWELKFIEADLLQAHVRFRGGITNASHIRDWRLPERPPAPGAEPARLWQRLLAGAELVRFTGRPELNAIFSGDARDWRTFDTTLKFTALAAESPWLSGTNLTLTAHLLPPPRSNDLVRIDLNASLAQARTPWAAATNLELTVVVEPSFTHLLPTNTLALLELQGAQADWGRAGRVFAELRCNPTATNAAFNETRLDVTVDDFNGPSLAASRGRVSATSVHSATNLFPAETESFWNFRDLQTPWASARWVQIAAGMNLPSRPVLRLAETNLPWPERLENIPISATVITSNLVTGRLELGRVGLKTRWRHPELTLSTDSALGESSATVSAALDTRTREAGFQLQMALDHPDIASFLPTNIRPWIAQAVFASPPVARLEGRAVLPLATNLQPDWRIELLPSLSLAGRIDAGTGTFRGARFTSIGLPFTLTNLHWATPDTRLVQGGRGISIQGASDLRNGDFQFAVNSDLDWLATRPAFSRPEAQQVFDFFQWTVPPVLTGTAHGNWNNPAATGFAGTVQLTNTTFRGQFVKSATARIGYTNKLLSIFEPVVLREGEHGRADGIGIDFVQFRLYLTNATGRMSPRAVTRAIGPQVDRMIEPFAFDGPVDAQVHGVVCMRRGDDTEDMRFEVAGGPFHWERFHLEQIQGALLWRGKTLTITNVQGRWRGADVDGSAFFQFTPKGQGDIFSFRTRVNGADLRTVLADLQPGKTNKVEGRVDGELIITRADTHDWKSWQGRGYARMTNGLLWDIPFFKVFSPILNAFFPGLGNSRAKHANTTFQITNSVITTRDMEIRATAMRMKFDGTVDFEQRVQGTMEAELLRDLPAVGYLVSKVFWPVTKLFEYEISGTLENPKTDQRYLLSKVFILPFQPFKTLKDLFTPGETPKEPAPK